MFGKDFEVPSLKRDTRNMLKAVHKLSWAELEMETGGPLNEFHDFYLQRRP